MPMRCGCGGRSNKPSSKPAQPSVSFRVRLLRAGLYFIFSLAGLVGLALLFRYLVAPALVFCFPRLDVHFYDFGVYGINPQQYYSSFSLTSETARTPKWNPSVCERENTEGGLVLLDVHGTGVTTSGPRIVDLKGNLIWTDDSYGEHAMNLRLQQWKGERYLTFWAGEGDKGQYYMLDSGFNHVKTVQAVGDGLQGDPHEFIITDDDTALIVVYNCTRDFDITSTYMRDMSPNIVDAIIQEIDLDSGELLFQWRASDHFDDGEYLKYTYDPSPATIPAQPECLYGEARSEPIDYFHLNSVSKDSKGNLLVSIRKTHQVICISRTTGKILWGFGGRATDFEVLEGDNGEAKIDFKWQHDARWVDEQNGILSLFDNGVSETYDKDDNPYSVGRIIHLDVNNRTARQLHSYRSLNRIRALSQGSFQVLPGVGHSSGWSNAGIAAGPRDLVFTGWGYAAAFSLHDADNEELLCETHYSPSLLFFLGRAKTYRAIRAPKDFNFRPELWDPQAVAMNGKAYVSWNGGMEVRSWVLQGRKKREGKWQDDLLTVPRNGFETTLDLPKDAKYKSYVVAALDADGNVLRHSNVFEPVPWTLPVWGIVLISLAATVLVSVTIAYVLRSKIQARIPPWLANMFSLGRLKGYQQLEPAEELEDFGAIEAG